MGLNFALKGKWRAAAGMLAFLMALPTLAGLLKFESKAATQMIVAGQILTYGYYLSDGTVSDADNYEIWFDQATGNVTLRNANITATDTNGLTLTGGGTLIVEGTNTITMTQSQDLQPTVSINVGTNNLTIEGSGTLNLNITGAVGKVTPLVAINCSNDVIIRGNVSVNVNIASSSECRVIDVIGGTDYFDSLFIQDNAVFNAHLICNNVGGSLYGSSKFSSQNFQLTMSGNAKLIIINEFPMIASESGLLANATIKDNTVLDITRGGNAVLERGNAPNIEGCKSIILRNTSGGTAISSTTPAALPTNYAYRETDSGAYTKSNVTPLDTTQVTSSYLEIVPMYTLTANDSDTSLVTAASSANDTVYYEGETVTLTQGTPNAGYEFDGWTSSEVTGITGNSFAMPAQNTTVTANWSVADYNITYNLDGGTVQTANPATYNVTTADITLNDPTKEHYTFDGWYTDATLQTPATAPQIPLGSTGAKEFYAKFTPIEYNIDYQMNGGGDKGTNPTTYNITDVITLAAAGIRDGYTFEGWYSDNNTFNNKVEQIGPNETGDKTLYAKWGTGYAGDIDVNGTDIPVTEGEVITLPTPSPVPDGYEFERWEVTPAQYTNNITDPTNPNSTFTVPGEYVSLTPKWTPIEYTITYNVGEGKNAASNPASYNIESETITLAEPTITGFYFGGWYTDAEYKNPVARIEKGSMGNRTLYAKWDEYKIIMGQGGIHRLKSGGTLSFTATGHFKDFTDVLVDNAVIDGNSYSAVEGSTVVTLTTEYLDTLSVGTHSITVRYNNGEASTTFEVQAAPLQGGGEQPPAGTTGGGTITGGGTAGNVIIPGRGAADNVVVFTETGTGYRAPKTFDETSIMLLGGAAFAAAVSLLGMAVIIKKRREYRE